MIPAHADQAKNSRSVVIDGCLHLSGYPNNGQTKQIFLSGSAPGGSDGQGN